MTTLLLIIAGIFCFSNGKFEERQDVQKPKIVKVQQAKVSWYSVRSNGGTVTASGAKFGNDTNIIAHKHLPFGTKVKFTNSKNGKEHVGIVKDRGPYIKGREFDLSKGMARKLDFVEDGVVRLNYTILYKPQ